MKPVYFKWDGNQTTFMDPVNVNTLQNNIPLNLKSKTLGNRAQKILINFSSASPASTLIFNLSGFDVFGKVISEQISIVSGIPGPSFNHYASIQSIIPTDVSGAVAGNMLQVVTNPGGYTQPFICDVYNADANYSFSVQNVIGTVSVIPQYTLDAIPRWDKAGNSVNRQPVYDYSSVKWFPMSAAITTNTALVWDTPCSAINFFVNVSTTGSFTGVIMQQGY